MNKLKNKIKKDLTVTFKWLKSKGWIELEENKNILQEYLEFTHTTAVYPKEKELEYLTLGLVSESGEVAGKVKKIIRGDSGLTNESVLLEIGDIFWYLVRLIDYLDSNVPNVLNTNIEKLSKRKQQHTIKGDGDNR